MGLCSNGIQMASVNITTVAIIALVSTSALAGPKQLNILGLIPGESELAQVQQAGVGDKSENLVTLEIGGHKILCSTSFINGKLSNLLCLTGEADGTQLTKASNIEVHETLKAGFTKKFGAPYSISNATVTTTMGMKKFNRQFVTWKDTRGNTLKLMSMTDDVRKGAILLMSSEELKRLDESHATVEARKKF